MVALDDDLLPIAFELGVDPGCLQRVERGPAGTPVARRWRHWRAAASPSPATANVATSAGTT